MGLVIEGDDVRAKKSKAKTVVVQLEKFDGSQVVGVFDSSITEWLDQRIAETKTKKEGDK